MSKFLLAILSLLLSANAFITIQSANAEPDLRAVGIEKSEFGNIRSDKVAEKLGAVIDEIDNINVSAKALDSAEGFESLSTNLIKVNNEGMIEVYIHCNETGEENLARLLELGLEPEAMNDDLKIIQGWIPHSEIDVVSELGFVDKITPPSYGHSRVGSITPNVVSEIGADRVLDELGIDGSGVKIGVISNGIGDLGDSQASGDLPFVQIGNAGSGNEGTAMLEIIHDIAPGADLAFHTGNSTVLFINAINFFINNGVDIIVDDIGYLTEPYFQDGSVAQAADDAVSQGKIFVSAAGNDQDRHYQAPYEDIDPGDDESDNHDFGAAAGEASTTRMAYSLPAGGSVTVFMQWTNPFGAASDDYDLFLVEPGTTDVIAQSDDVQNGDDDPIEAASVVNNGSTAGIFEVVIDKFSGEGQTLEIFFNGNGSLLEFNVPDDSIYGHPAAADVIAVGATFNGQIDFFSSFGPSSIFFGPVVTVSSLNRSIERDAPLLEARAKPEISAPNRIPTTVPGFSNFAGTSAAAPVLAASAALVYQAVEFREDNLSLSAQETLTATRQTPDEIKSILMSTADDLNPPGFDDMSGAGIVDAFAAVEDALQGLTGPGVDPGDGGDPGNGNGNGNGGGGGCSLISPGSSAQNSAAMLNILILLIPAILVARRFIWKRV